MSDPGIDLLDLSVEPDGLEHEDTCSIITQKGPCDCMVATIRHLQNVIRSFIYIFHHHPLRPMTLEECRAQYEQEREDFATLEKLRETDREQVVQLTDEIQQVKHENLQLRRTIDGESPTLFDELNDLREKNESLRTLVLDCPECQAKVQEMYTTLLSKTFQSGKDPLNEIADVILNACIHQVEKGTANVNDARIITNALREAVQELDDYRERMQFILERQGWDSYTFPDGITVVRRQEGETD